MDKERAKEFMYIPLDEKVLYISKSLDKIIDIDSTSKHLISVYAVVDTASGEKLFEMDYSYSDEPIIMRVFLHKDYILKHYWNRKIIEL